MSLLFAENSLFIYRSKSSQRLISHDIHSNVYNYKSTFSVEIVPICKVVASLCFIFRVFSSQKEKREELGFGDGGHIVGFGEGSMWEMQNLLGGVGWENENMMKK